MNPLTKKVTLGIDLGGTNLRLGIVDESGSVIEFHSEPINPFLCGDDLVALIASRAREMNLFPETRGMGLAISASVLKDGKLQPGTTNIPGLGGFTLCESLSQQLGNPCLVDNDANLALLGEAHFGAARSMSDVLLLTLGTGVGGGLLLGGILRRGAHSSGCEMGLMVVPGLQGAGYVTLESLAAPGAIMRRLGEPRGMLFEYAEAEGDDEAISLIEQMYEYLGMTIANVHILLDLELVLLAGGLAGSGQMLCDAVQRSFERICPKNLQFGLRIELANLPPNAGGVIGAACLWFENEGHLPRI
ncbi:MAG: ROK family protein [Anaerolineales bacterium]|nr:ROK family protein [Anaerolineales bacterium]